MNGKNDKWQKFIESVRSLRLSAAEKSSIKLALVREMEASRLAAAVAGSRPAFAFAWARNWRLPVSAALLLAVFAGGISSAAEHALPGDRLYPIKVAVNERLRAALIKTPAARLAWEAERVARRLVEAEILAARAQLDTAGEAILVAGLETAMAAFEKSLGALPPGEVALAAEANADLAVKLKAHARVLADITKAAPPKTDSDAVAILNTIRVEEIKVAKRRQLTTPASATESTLQAARHRLDNAEKKVEEIERLVKKLADKKKPQLNAREQIQISERIQAVAETISAGQTRFSAGDSAGTLNSLEQAVDLAEETMILLEAKQRLEKEEQRGRSGRQEGLTSSEAAPLPVEQPMINLGL